MDEILKSFTPLNLTKKNPKRPQKHFKSKKSTKAFFLTLWDYGQNFSFSSFWTQLNQNKAKLFAFSWFSVSVFREVEENGKG